MRCGIGSKFSMDRFYGRLDKVTTEYRFFLHNEFKWDTRNLETLQQQIPGSEAATFNTSVKEMHFQSYIDSIVIGLKKFMMKQDMSLKQKEIAKSENQPSDPPSKPQIPQPPTNALSPPRSLSLSICDVLSLVRPP